MTWLDSGILNSQNELSNLSLNKSHKLKHNRRLLGKVAPIFKTGSPWPTILHHLLTYFRRAHKHQTLIFYKYVFKKCFPFFHLIWLKHWEKSMQYKLFCYKINIFPSSNCISFYRRLSKSLFFIVTSLNKFFYF